MQSMRTPALLLAAALALSAGSQQPASQSTLDLLTGVIQDYARDVTENRFDVKSTITSYDPAGKRQKFESTTHVLEFTKGRYAGVGEESAWNGSFQITRAKNADIGAELYSDMGAFVPIFVLNPGERSRWDFQSSDLPGSRFAMVSYRSHEQCATFVPGPEAALPPGPNGFGFAKWRCGSGQVILDENAAIPLRTNFDALGFPVSSGKKVMTGYHVEDEYQKVSMPGGKQQFLFPARATATFTFVSGRIVVECEYTLATGPKK
jgi:hypothetical protein